MVNPTEKFDEIRKKVNEGLYLNQVPKPTRAEFTKWAKEEFADNRGMALKWLWDFKQGLLSNPNQLLSEQIELLANEIEQLKVQPLVEQKKAIKNLQGKTIAERRE